MTKTLTQAVAFTLAAVVTVSTFAAANGLATQQFAKAERAVATDLQVAAGQTVVVVGHPRTKA